LLNHSEGREAEGGANFDGTGSNTNIGVEGTPKSPKKSKTTITL